MSSHLPTFACSLLSPRQKCVHVISLSGLTLALFSGVTQLEPSCNISQVVRYLDPEIASEVRCNKDQATEFPSTPPSFVTPTMAKSRSTYAPRRCRKCSHFPLQSQCIHTVAGREYLSKQKADTVQCQEELADIFSPDTSPASMNMAGPIPTQSVGGSVPVTPTRGTSTTQAPEFALDPQLLALDPITPQLITETPASLPLPTPSTEIGEHEAGTRSDEPGTPSKGTPRATVNNPIYDLVEGVKRGSLKYNIARKKLLPKALQDAPTSTRRFNRLMQDVLIRCERLAAETGCWLYLSGQHVNANMGFYNYASPRLRREAKAQVEEIQQASNVMYTSLLYARRRDAVTLSVQAQKAQAELQKAQQEMAEKDAEIADLRSRLDAQASEPMST